MRFILPGRCGGRGDRPSGLVLINRASPQANGLRIWWPDVVGERATPINRGGNLNDAVKRVGVPSHGLTAQFTAGVILNGAQLTNGLAAGFAKTDPFTISLWHQTPSYVSLSTMFGVGDNDPGVSNGTTGALRLFLQFNNDYYLWGNGADFDTGIALDVDNTVHHAAFTSDGTTVTFYRDGVALATQTIISGGAGNWITSGTTVSSGYGHTAAASAPTSKMWDSRIYTRALSAQEMWALYEPSTRWDLYAVPATRVFFDVGTTAPAQVPYQPNYQWAPILAQ